MNGLLALKLALRAHAAAPEPEPEPQLDLSPVIDQLSAIRLTLGSMSKMPRPVAA